MDNYRACEVAEGFGNPPRDEDEVREAWQYLHDTGLAYRLQGWYGRTARDLIEEGFIIDHNRGCRTDGHPPGCSCHRDAARGL
ncbi:MAG: hypothetical protein KGL39_28235 [Patescibacteria group bacterium]|nr:hypothetical protein [Patescibacteria group bacterium]